MSEESQERLTVANGALTALRAEVEKAQALLGMGDIPRASKNPVVEAYFILEAALQQPAEAAAPATKPVCSFAHNQLMGIFNCDFDEGKDDCNVHPGERVQAATEPVCEHSGAIRLFHPDFDKSFTCQQCGMNSTDDGRTWFQPASESAS